MSLGGGLLPRFLGFALTREASGGLRRCGTLLILQRLYRDNAADADTAVFGLRESARAGEIAQGVCPFMCGMIGEGRASTGSRGR